MHGHLCMIDFCSQPEPIFVPFKQLLPHRFPFTRSEVACPVILAHVKSLFYIGFCRQKSKCPRVHCGGVHRGENRRRYHNDGRQQGGRAEKDLCERVHPEFSQSFLMMSLPSRIVISLTFLTDSAEMRALPILIRGVTSTKAS